MKLPFSILILLISSYTANAQVAPKFYAGLKAYYNKSYESNTYGGFEVGTEIFRYKFLAPEIGFSYYSGKPDKKEFLDFSLQRPEGRARYDGRFHSFNFSLAPKLIFGNKEAALVIIPSYNFGKMKSYERYFKRFNDQYKFSEEVNALNNISFWNFSAGVEGDFFGLDRINFSFLVTYTTLNSKKAFDDLEFSDSVDNYNEGSTDGLGITFRAYFDIFKN